jgi:hypothetical protein
MGDVLKIVKEKDALDDVSGSSSLAVNVKV